MAARVGMGAGWNRSIRVGACMRRARMDACMERRCMHQSCVHAWQMHVKGLHTYMHACMHAQASTCRLCCSKHGVGHALLALHWAMVCIASLWHVPHLPLIPPGSHTVACPTPPTPRIPHLPPPPGSHKGTRASLSLTSGMSHTSPPQDPTPPSASGIPHKYQGEFVFDQWHVPHRPPPRIPHLPPPPGSHTGTRASLWPAASTALARMCGATAREYGRSVPTPSVAVPCAHVHTLSPHVVFQDLGACMMGSVLA
eukprot:354578-Chlamydomonas_euryale.AAC.2